jgi:hypothetical protein
MAAFSAIMVLGICFWISAFFSIFFLVFTIRKSKYRIFIRDQTVLFWGFMVIWQIYHGAISVARKIGSPMHPTNQDWFWTVDRLLMFVPMCLVILILFELLFTYRNPGANAITFFRALYLLFLFTFLVLGFILPIVHGKGEVTDPILLWCACSDLILAVFFALPAKSLLEAVTYPMVQPEDVCCVNACKVGIILYLILFGGRTVWNAAAYYGDFLNTKGEGAKQDGKVWKGGFMWFFIFDFVTSVLAMISVYLFKRHDLMFNENPDYTRQNE